MKKKKMKKATRLMSVLPDELVVEILLRLPVKSLLHLKCVCKLWLSLISNPQFVKSHFDLAAAPTHRLMYCDCDPSLNLTKYISIDPEASLHDDSKKASFYLPRPLNTLSDCWGVRTNSCRGFILFQQTNMDFIVFSICNLSTGFQKRIQYKRIHHKYRLHTYLFGFGYDSSTDDYVIVVGLFPISSRIGPRCIKFQCFSVRADSWSCIIEHTVPYNIMFAANVGSPFMDGLYLKGAIHWFTNNSYDHRIIMVFDVVERKLSDISLPRDLAMANTRLFRLKTVGECLCILSESYYPAPKMSEMWIMKEYKEESSWTKLFVLSDDYYSYFSEFDPICFTDNDEILGSDDNKTLVRLNHRGKLLEHRTHRGKVFDQFTMYRESLLSLPSPDNSGVDNKKF